MPQALHRGFAVADRDGDGSLDRPEYDEAMAIEAELYGDGEHSARKREMFRSLDADGNGVVTRDEAGARTDIARGFVYADTNGDGQVDAGEFSEISLQTLASSDPNPAR